MNITEKELQKIGIQLAETISKFSATIEESTRFINILTKKPLIKKSLSPKEYGKILHRIK